MAIRNASLAGKQSLPLSNATEAEYRSALLYIENFNQFQGRAFLHGTARNKLNEARTTLFHGIQLFINNSLVEAARYKPILSVPK
jgi:hypothetical protein